MKTISGQKLKDILISGSNNLFNHYPEIDALNVFPVPDGDTGMNMNLTCTSGMMEIQNRNDNNAYEIAKAFSRGLLMGARGNSGVITSQIFRGFAMGLEGVKEISVSNLITALNKGVEIAYKAVVKPVEGTILTVMREATEYTTNHVKDFYTIEKVFDILIKAAKQSLIGTPNLLPILKEVGVVDSGGAGLIKILEGMRAAMTGDVIERDKTTVMVGAPLMAAARLKNEEFGYCTEFIMELGPELVKKQFNEKRFTTIIGSHGNSLVIVRDENLVKLHVHTLHPGSVLNYAQQFGEFKKIKVENMTEQHHALENGAYEADGDQISSNIPRVPHAVIAVSSGSGIDEYFNDLGVTHLVSGGQTMNPSAEDFVKAIKKAHANNVYILPNNSNIIMAANQAAEIIDNDIKVFVIPTKSIPQGFAAALMFNEDEEGEENFSMMKEAINDVKTGEVTFAIRDTEIGGVKIKKDSYMGIFDGKIVVSLNDKFKALNKLIKQMVDDDTSILTILCGEDISDNEIDNLNSSLSEEYSDIDLDIRRGNQAVYSFIVGAQ